MNRAFLAVLSLLPLAARVFAADSYQDWVRQEPRRAGDVRAFEAFLGREGVGDVLPVDELLRNATSWRACGLESPWSMPPRALWRHIVPTLKFVRDEIVPRIGPVAVESGWREPKLNACAHGAPFSAHAQFYALDLLPEHAAGRKSLTATLCKVQRERGRAYNLGRGFYGGVRFHVDTKAYRRWGSDNHSGTSPCTKAGA
ncbi:MAG TPA: D-Ala-D-Ala carboxypeptidase family metallohydrolase [Rhizomicrobium sp.]|nr:D-Ala-D-Ala carboxypeptidase family metallohydrolase [Rhizomicrobium sp.]